MLVFLRILFVLYSMKKWEFSRKFKARGWLRGRTPTCNGRRRKNSKFDFGETSASSRNECFSMLGSSYSLNSKFNFSLMDQLGYTDHFGSSRSKLPYSTAEKTDHLLAGIHILHRLSIPTSFENVELIFLLWNMHSIHLRNITSIPSLL